MKEQKYNIKTAGEDISLSVNDLSENAEASILLESKGTTVFIALTKDKNDTSLDYFPLSVDFEEKFYSIGKILGGRFTRRESRPSEEAVLSGRIIDRTIRPLFDKNYLKGVQVVASVLSRGEGDPEILSIIGSSVALSISSIPWDGPVGAVKLNRTSNGWSDEIITRDRILICGKEDSINMIEMEGLEVKEDDILSAAEIAKKDIGEQIKLQKNIIKDLAKEKEEVEKKDISEESKKVFLDKYESKLNNSIFDEEGDLEMIKKEWLALAEENGEDVKNAENYFYGVLNKIVHVEGIKNEKRLDGRGLDEIRPLFAKAGDIGKNIHGSGIFYRGGTHVLSTLTLGSLKDTLLQNSIEAPEEEKRFFHHYNFPPYATGETGRIGSPKRREIGHGALVEKALKNVIPDENTFPYTIRLVSECLSSNGSTSMGSTCASTIALLDGGVPILEPVAGIAMGVLIDENKNYKILTDIQGKEDHYGDMDLKVAGTRNGITALQMDVKVNGISIDILEKSLESAKTAREKILEAILNEISSHRDTISENVPLSKKIKIHKEDIGRVIGSGGKVINEIRDKSAVSDIDIEDDGSINIYGTSEAIKIAEKMINGITKKIEVGEEFDVQILKIVDFGAFAKISESKDGLIHISEIKMERVGNVDDVLKVGDTVPVVVKKISPEGKIGLSIKDRDPHFFDSK